MNLQTPVMTLKGHKEAISSVQWTDSQEICTASWDHTLKLWDTEIGGIKNEVVGNKSFFDASWSHLNRTLITASADRHVRLYDPRSKGLYNLLFCSVFQILKELKKFYEILTVIISQGNAHLYKRMWF